MFYIEKKRQRQRKSISSLFDSRIGKEKGKIKFKEKKNLMSFVGFFYTPAV